MTFLNNSSRPFVVMFNIWNDRHTGEITISNVSDVLENICQSGVWRIEASQIIFRDAPEFYELTSAIVSGESRIVDASTFNKLCGIIHQSIDVTFEFIGAESAKAAERLIAAISEGSFGNVPFVRIEFMDSTLLKVSSTSQALIDVLRAAFSDHLI